MKKTTIMTLTAVAALMGATSAMAQQERSVSASVSAMSDSDTGFMHGGRAEVDGVGTAAVTVSRGDASIATRLGTVASIDPDTGIPTSSSEMITVMDYTRDVSTSASLNGIGRAVSIGFAEGGIGITGEAKSDVRTSELTPEFEMIARSAETMAIGDLSGKFSTKSEIVLAGREDLFSQSQSLQIGERTVGLSAGITGILDGGSRDGIDFSTLAFADVPGSGSSFSTDDVSGTGAGFLTNSTLTHGPNLDLMIDNAGGGSVSVSGATGGFFRGGSAASGATMFSLPYGY